MDIQDFENKIKESAPLFQRTNNGGYAACIGRADVKVTLDEQLRCARYAMTTDVNCPEARRANVLAFARRCCRVDKGKADAYIDEKGDLVLCIDRFLTPETDVDDVLCFLSALGAVVARGSRHIVSGGALCEAFEQLESE